MTTIDPRYGTGQWKTLRKAIRARDGGECQIRGRGCTHVATAVDHIEEPGPYEHGRDDLFFSPANCRAACGACNTAKRNARTNRLARQALNGTPADPWGIPDDIAGSDHLHASWSQEWFDCDCRGCLWRRVNRPQTVR